LDERSKIVQRVRADQIEEMDAFLIAQWSARRMNDRELAREGNRLAGWFADLTADDRRFTVRILLSRDFPFHPPEVYLQETSYYLKFPHVEKTGKLCLVSGPASFSPARPTATVNYLLEQARRLLSESITGANRDDFILEFQSYWPGHLSERTTPLWSILESNQETRLVYYWSGKRFTLIAETPEQCRRWIRNLNDGVSIKGMEILPTVFAWLKKPIYPEEYPASGAAFRRLAQTSNADIDQILFQVAPQESRTLPVIFGFSTANGPVLGGLVLKEPKVSNTAGQIARECKTDGFRQGKVPREVLSNRYFGSMPAIGANVFRADVEWLHTRGGNGSVLNLASKRIGILGCGSLGADIAFVLAKSGVGNLYLIDNQIFTLDNVGRHLLGVEYVGHHKSDALQTFLQKQLPGLSVENGGGRNIELLLRENPTIFDDLDLLISTTGDWASDCTLNVAARNWPSFPPIIFGWTEAYGIAGHALLVNDHGGCLACGMTEHGSFQGQVIEWEDPDKTFVHVSGCGDFYQPYGVTDVTSTKAIISELALSVLNQKAKHSEWHTWIGNLSQLSSLHGTLREPWSSKMPPADLSRRFFCQPWQTNPQCPLCKD